MREKKPALVVTFDTTAAAIEAEHRCQELGLPGRIIPVPREITAGCGLAWKAPTEAEAQIRAAFQSEGLSWAAMEVLML